MQEALPALVLNSEALARTAMNETPTNEVKTAGDAGAASAASDEQLMLAFSKGSSEAFSELFSRYKQPVYGFFRRRVSDPAHAEELTQETFLVLLRAAARYQPRSLFRTYLYAIGFKILQAHRRKAAFRVLSLGKAIRFPIPLRPTPRSPACGSATPSRSSTAWIAKFFSSANSSN
jgi:hypothetical protein